MINSLKSWLILKLNPSQYQIGNSTESSQEPVYTYEQMYESIEIVQRGVNMIVDDCAEIDVKILGQLSVPGVSKGERKAKILNLLNVSPNPFQDINDFKRNLLIDYIIDGNVFIYYDGAHLYHLPACKMQVVGSSTTYVEKYTFNSVDNYSPNEIIHIKENSFSSIYRGTSRLRSALRSMQLIMSMSKFQGNFFRNGAVPGLVLTTPDILSQPIKDKMVASWMQAYKPDGGGRRPLILDGGMKLEPLSKTTFNELEFESSLDKNEIRVLKALGIPPILLDGGNNANIAPNLRLYYLETVLSIATKFNFAFTRFFGYKIVSDTANIVAMHPELNIQADYLSSLVNGGIISPNEARDELGKDAKTGHDDIRIPTNVAGSAANPSVGGKPSGKNN